MSRLASPGNPSVGGNADKPSAFRRCPRRKVSRAIANRAESARFEHESGVLYRNALSDSARKRPRPAFCNRTYVLIPVLSSPP